MNKFFLIVLLAFVMTGCQSYKSPLSAGCRGRIAWSSERTAV